MDGRSCAPHVWELSALELALEETLGGPSSTQFENRCSLDTFLEVHLAGHSGMLSWSLTTYVNTFKAVWGAML